MPRINKLPDLLINKIAAGEVIERPASVVKELVENAIDAGATRIKVQVEEGGRKLIRIVDNGVGISAEDLPLAIAPHATSKIRHEDDLFHIGTLGFRGEALASIGAVAHLRLLSRPADSTAGAVIQVAGERIERHDNASCAVGTTIEVRDLFFNVPARRKFLRAAQTEMGHITEQVARVSLAHPDIHFELLSGERVLRRAPVTEDPRRRITDFYGGDLDDDLLPVSGAHGGLGLSGFIGRPQGSRNSTKWQYVFLNRRFIRDRQINHAVRESYRGLMEATRHPVVFLFLDIDPRLVDVNVHPTKTEVRWQDGRAVHSLVSTALRETLAQQDLTHGLSSRTAERVLPRAGADSFFNSGGRDRRPFRDPVIVPTAADRARSASQPIMHARATRPAVAPADPVIDAPITTPPVIQLHRTYLVTETDDGMIVYDQHALHERILYEKFRERLTQDDLESQQLLIPQTIDLADPQVAALDEHRDLLRRIGIEFTLYGASTIAVQAVPTLLKPDETPRLIRDLADLLSDQDGEPRTETLIHRTLDMMACKAAVKAGDILTEDERRNLIDQRHLADRHTHCPHGRPTALRFSLSDLERQFKRK